MNASRPYLLRALYEWILDNGKTPYVLVDADIINVVVPREHVNNGKIVLNIDPQAVQDLKLTNTAVSFSARFARGHIDCYLPIPAVLAIYASENGKGMFFNDEDLGDETFTLEEVLSQSESGKKDRQGTSSSSSKISHLTVVK